MQIAEGQVAEFNQRVDGFLSTAGRSLRLRKADIEESLARTEWPLLLRNFQGDRSDGIPRDEISDVMEGYIIAAEKAMARLETPTTLARDQALNMFAYYSALNDFAVRLVVAEAAYYQRFNKTRHSAQSTNADRVFTLAKEYDRQLGVALAKRGGEIQIRSIHQRVSARLEEASRMIEQWGNLIRSLSNGDILRGPTNSYFPWEVAIP
jgi:hypothetical protein